MGLVREEGLGGLSIRDLARRAGTTTPTLYSYFEFKHAIFDAMFAGGQRDFGSLRSTGRPQDPIEALRWLATTLVQFCAEDPVRYQLLFQRPIPGFEPSESSFELSRHNLEMSQECSAAVGLDQQLHLDLWTAVWAGLIAQQTANDPGGDRWTRHVDVVLEMYLNQFLPGRSRPRRSS